MEYTIKEVYQMGETVYVVVDHAYGTDKFGFSLESLKLDPQTDAPRYLSKTKTFLEMKYGDKKRRKKQIKCSYIGKKINHPDINIGAAK